MKKKIWIDLDNSPHVPFFKPIIEELNNRGYTVMLTARDCFQVCELADRVGLSYRQVGRHYGKNKILKVFGLLFRALQLAPVVLNEKPNLALSHGSRSQLLLSKLLGIPSIVIFDYEYAKVLVHPSWAIAPEIIPDKSIKLNKKYIRRYPGIKEDVYVPSFKPDPHILNELGIHEDDLVVTVRPPATEAHYHNPQSEELFAAAMNFLGNKQNVRIVVLPRTDKQGDVIKNQWQELYNNGKIIIPKNVVDGLNLIWYSDLVISGGGTMNREAAALGVPVYSIFRGTIGAVDRYLADMGRLTLLEHADDVQRKILLSRRDKKVMQKRDESGALRKIVDEIEMISKTYS